MKILILFYLSQTEKSDLVAEKHLLEHSVGSADQNLSAGVESMQLQLTGHHLRSEL